MHSQPNVFPSFSKTKYQIMYVCNIDNLNILFSSCLNGTYILINPSLPLLVLLVPGCIGQKMLLEKKLSFSKFMRKQPI